MKKFVLILFLLIAVFGSAAAQTCDCGELQAQVDALTMQVQVLLDQMDTVDLGKLRPVSTNTKFGYFDQVVIGDYAVDCYGFAIEKTQTNKQVIELMLYFRNNSETETANFASQIRLKAFQSGVGLLEGKNYDSSKDLRPGKASLITKTYVLLSPEVPVELEFAPIRADQDPEIRMIDLSGQ